MGNFEQILARIKDITGKTKNKEIAELLKTNESTFGKWVSRKKIPFEQILDLCIENNYDMKFIFYGIGQNEIISNNNIENSSNTIIGNNNKIAPSSNNKQHNKLLENIERLPQKRQDYYFHSIYAEVLNLED